MPPVIGDQTRDILFLSERLSETLLIGQPLQRLSSAASQRPQKNRRTFCNDNFHSCLRVWPGLRVLPWPGQTRAQAVTEAQADCSRIVSGSGVAVYDPRQPRTAATMAPSGAGPGIK